MDDDIDIEEHDVMDNPRIKSIFPDLSCVKIELPDDEDIIEENYEILQPSDEPQEMLYQYEYCFETQADNVPEDEALSQEAEDYEDEEDTTCFYNNEIILGSKPPVDLNLLYDEALNSHPIVFLENWGERLKSSPCFCENCEILFPTVNALDAHKMISHSYLIAMESPQKNTARKSTATSKYCNHCSKTFPDDTSLIKHLYELLPLNNFSKVKEEKEPETSTLKKYSQMPWPKKIKSTSHVITKLHAKKDSDKNLKVTKVKHEDSKVKLKKTLSRDGKFFAASSLVPKSTLFQCNLCQICFVSCFSATQHAKSCKIAKSLSSVKCGICKKKIKSKDVSIHALQHTYNDKLKIYTVNKSIYERVLCRCPKCSSCLDELAFWAHYQKCKNFARNSIFCSICDVNIALPRYKGHQLKHSSKKLTKKDFIIIDFYDQNAEKVYSESQDDIMPSEDMESIIKERRRQQLLLNDSKDKDDITLYYCQFCGCCQYILNFKGHKGGACRYQAGAKRFCEKCGLCFTAKSISSHLILHEKRSFSLKDINIINLLTGKVIDPPMSKFLECQKCSKHFLCRRTLTLHVCKTEKYITCKVCSKKFNIQAYKIHKIFHSVDKLMPELMKKYNLINSTWNIMFMCVSCELVTMTYDSAVNHSQGHLNYIMSDLHKQCVVCDLRIAEKEFHLHAKLHTNNDAIERESFKILTYNHKNLFKKEWLQVFKELPKEHRQQILSKSIYRYTRSVKMQLEVRAQTDDTKYFCVNCNHFVEGPNIRQHVLSKCFKNNKFVCNVCHEIFKSLKQFLAHEGSHETSPKRQTIVSFNNECDKEFNTHLSLIESQTKKKAKDVPLSKLREILMADNTKATYKLYKCAKCETCLTLKSSCRRHRCVSDGERRYCAICEQYFCSKQTSTHVRGHKKKPYINKYSFHIIYFNDGSKTSPKKLLSLKRDSTGKFLPRHYSGKMTSKNYVTPKTLPKKDGTAKISPKKPVIAKIFKCVCGLHFTAMKTVEKHLYHCSPTLDVSKETCSKCNLLFPTDVLVTHLINHHHKEMKIVIENVVRNNLWKCPQCLIFFTSMDYFNAHVDNCDSKNGTKCTECLMTFGEDFEKHLCSSEDTTYFNKITVVRKKQVKEGTVYRCAACDICYLRRNSFKYHTTEINHSLKKTPTACEICGLRFTNCSFKKHSTVHSFPNEDYKIQIIEPDTGHVEVITGHNRVISKDDSNSGSRKSARKRRGDISEHNRSLAKKAKTSETYLDVALSERRSARKANEKNSTSDKSRIFDETPTEIIVPDEISNHTTENISEIDNDSEMTSQDVTNESLDKNGISVKLKSRILVKGYSNKLYKCIYCGQHYLKESSFDYHVKSHKLQELSENHTCDICELDFSRYTLPRHKYVHHDNMGLKKDDFLIFTETSYSKESEILHRIKNLNPPEEVLQRIVKSMSKNESKILNLEDNASETDNINDIIVADANVSGICDINPRSDSNPLSDTNSFNDTNTISETSQLSDVKISEISDITDISDTDKICYYKCFDCNVCYVEQKMCLEHTQKHEILDPKTYIQCKLCDFQFLIDSLKEHMVFHHSSDFKIESLTIHEYKSLGIGLDPKIEIYQAVDKLQSRLVSTTTDVGVLS